MKLSLLPQTYFPRRTNSLPSAETTSPKPFPASISYLLLHFLCCLISLILGFRLSRMVFFLLFSSSTTVITTVTTTTTTLTQTLTLPLLPSPHNKTQSGVAVGRHGILIRPWPHPNPDQTMRAHHLIERVQKEQRTVYYGIKKPKPLIVITPTYVRTFQAMYLTGLMHSLMLVPYDFTWLVVEAGGVSNETASILDRSHLNYVHVPFNEGKKMPVEWGERRKMEARMRLHALRVVREKKMDGIVVFADDSNIHSTEMFDEIQKVKHIGAISVGFLTHSDIEEENHSIPIQGPECTPSGKFIGMQTLDPSSNKLEWAGFVLSSRLLWENVEERPNWVQNIDDLEIESPLALLKDASYVEPLGNCGKKIMVWWIRSEARADSKFPAGWVIDSPSKSPVPSRHSSSTSDYLTRLRHDKMNNTNKEHMERNLDGKIYLRRD